MPFYPILKFINPFVVKICGSSSKPIQKWAHELFNALHRLVEIMACRADAITDTCAIHRK